MLSAAELKDMAERLAREVGRFSPGSDAFRTLNRAAEAVRCAEGDVRRHDASRGLRQA
jgi:hypothetical protein